MKKIVMALLMIIQVGVAAEDSEMFKFTQLRPVNVDSTVPKEEASLETLKVNKNDKVKKVKAPSKVKARKEIRADKKKQRKDDRVTR